MFGRTLVDGWSISCELALKWMSLDPTDHKSILFQANVDPVLWRHMTSLGKNKLIYSSGLRFMNLSQALNKSSANGSSVMSIMRNHNDISVPQQEYCCGVLTQPKHLKIMAVRTPKHQIDRKIVTFYMHGIFMNTVKMYIWCLFDLAVLMYLFIWSRDYVNGIWQHKLFILNCYLVDMTRYNGEHWCFIGIFETHVLIYFIQTI